MQQKIPVTHKAVVLVNQQDAVVGCAEKIHAHQHALLHRAFSICIFNQRHELLLQQRAHCKYHCAGLWTNTCCSHAQLDEPIAETAQQRLLVEMGISTPLSVVGTFCYRAELANGLWEHELDHVFVGWYEGDIAPHPDEVAATRWISIPALREAMKSTPEAYTPWLEQAVDVALTHPRFQPK